MMKNRIWLAMAFLLMIIAVPMAILLTITVNSPFFTARFFWFGSLLLMVGSALLACFYLKRGKQSNR
jgi:hypothetical protein